MPSKNDGFGGSSTKYDAWGEMTAKYAGRRRGVAKDVAPAAQLTSMGPPSREVETATGSTGEAEKNGSELENVSHFKFDRPAVEVAAAIAVTIELAVVTVDLLSNVLVGVLAVLLATVLVVMLAMVLEWLCSIDSQIVR